MIINSGVEGCETRWGEHPKKWRDSCNISLRKSELCSLCLCCVLLFCESANSEVALLNEVKHLSTFLFLLWLLLSGLKLIPAFTWLNCSDSIVNFFVSTDKLSVDSLFSANDTQRAKALHLVEKCSTDNSLNEFVKEGLNITSEW